MNKRRKCLTEALGLMVLLAVSAHAQKPSAAVQADWDDLLQDTIPKSAPDPVLTQPQQSVNQGAAGDFLNHFYFETRSEYWRSDTSFTGLPTITGLINAPFTSIFNPNGYPYPPAFQPDANRFYTIWDWGTRGWLSDRVDSSFTVRYRTDLTSVNLAAPASNILETYQGSRLYELLTASVTINGKPTDGFFAGTSLQIGRQHVYGAEFADLDGASFTVNRQDFSFDIFGGRRFTYFSDPVQRAIAGAGITWRLDPSTSLSYEAFVYVHATHRVNFRRKLTPTVSLASYFRVYGGAPVDFDVDVFYHPRDGKSSLHAAFFQKLTDKDYSYDYTEAARDLAAYNTYYRLNLGSVPVYSQAVVNGNHAFKPWLTLGGSVWIRQLADKKDQGPFETSFQDYRANAQVVPARKLLTSFEYHHRNSDRLPPNPNTTFDDISTSGETRVTDLTGDVRRTFGEGGRLTLSGGVYYRRFSIQDKFLSVQGFHQSGWLSGASIKADQHTRVFFDFALDNDFFVFRPSIQDSKILRVGVAWKY